MPDAPVCRLEALIDVKITEPLEQICQGVPLIVQDASGLLSIGEIANDN